MEKVLPCPFCGSRASLNTHRKGKSAIRNHYWRGHIKCSNSKCGATSMSMRSPEAAIKWWNRRAPVEISTTIPLVTLAQVQAAE